MRRYMGAGDEDDESGRVAAYDARIEQIRARSAPVVFPEWMLERFEPHRPGFRWVLQVDDAICLERYDATPGVI